MQFARLAIACVAAAASTSALAGTVTTSNPSGTNEMGARIRWGNTGFEAGLYDGGTAASNLNPVGTPVWTVGAARNFEVSFDSMTGTLGLKIDFNGDNSFGTGETLSKSTFVAPGLTSYVGKGFRYIQINGNESGSAARSNISSLVINGTSHSNIAPNGGFVDTFFKDSANQVMTNILITGKITFTTAGTAQERPSYNFNFLNAETPAVVPLPAAAWMGLGLMGAAAGASKLRRRSLTA